MRVKSLKYKVLRMHDLGIMFRDGVAEVPETKLAKLRELDADGRYGFLFDDTPMEAHMATDAASVCVPDAAPPPLDTRMDLGTEEVDDAAVAEFLSVVHENLPGLDGVKRADAVPASTIGEGATDAAHASGCDCIEKGGRV